MGIGVQQGIPGSGRRRQWLPTSLANLIAWFRSDLGITRISGLVSAWGDQSGNGRHLAQGTPAHRLAYNDSDAAFNGRPTLEGTGNAWLDAIAAWTIAQPLTVYVVGVMANHTDYQTFLDASAGARDIVRVTAGEALSLYGGTTNIEPGAVVTSPSIVCAVFNGASSAGYVSNVTASITGNPGSGGLGTPRVGAGFAGAYPMIALSKIGEIIVVGGAHDTTQRAQVFRYASAFWARPVTGL